MHPFKPVKICFFFAVLLFVAKPFIGFTMFNSLHPPASTSILVKAFTKRKQEYVENSSYDIHTIQKKLADPVRAFILRFSFLLSLIFSAVCIAAAGITKRFLRRMELNLSPRPHNYLLNLQLII
jgi:hypothetical protein